MKHIETRSLSAALLIGACMFAGATAAQITVNRTVPLPADLSQAPRAIIEPDVLPLVRLNGKPARLTAGSKIFGADNMLVLPANIPPGALVRVKRDQNGDVNTVWILTAQEAKQR
jgi:hypothetical protein